MHARFNDEEATLLVRILEPRRCVMNEGEGEDDQPPPICLVGCRHHYFPEACGFLKTKKEIDPTKLIQFRGAAYH